MARVLLIGCTFFVVFGVCVAYFGVFPLVLPYLMSWVPEGVTLQLRMNETISLIIKGMLGFAAAFQFPMVVLVLVYLGLLSPATLRQYRKIAIVIMSIVAAILTPPDPISMTVMLVPLVILYELSIWMSYFIVYRKKKAALATES
jgi:sec-independent protein translocase protein TatC